VSISKFVTPGTTTITLPDGDWIVVKNYLTVGEIREAARKINGEGPNGERIPKATAGYAQTDAYLLDWSLMRDGKTVPIDTDARRRSALDAMHGAAYLEIEQAINRHIDQMAAELEDAKKKTQDGPTNSKAT
jgi:hypothetical protein